MTRRPEHCRDDRGAALIMAICFVVVVGAIGGGLASLATSGLNNRRTLAAVRDREYAADGAIELAISQVRRSVGAPLSACPALPDSFVQRKSVKLNELTIWVDAVDECDVDLTGDNLFVTRYVTFSACVGDGPCRDADVIIRARVNFQQSTTGEDTTYVKSWSANL